MSHVSDINCLCAIASRACVAGAIPSDQPWASLSLHVFRGGSGVTFPYERSFEGTTKAYDAWQSAIVSDIMSQALMPVALGFGLTESQAGLGLPTCLSPRLFCIANEQGRSSYQI